MDTSTRKEGNERGDVASEVHELKFTDFRLHSPLRMYEPVFLLPSLELSTNVEVHALPSFMSLAPHYIKENFKETLYYADFVDTFAERDPLDKALAISAELLNRFREFIFNPDRILRSELYRVFGDKRLIHFGKLVDSSHYLVRVGLEGLIPNPAVEGGEMVDKIINKPVTLSLCTLEAHGFPAQADHHLKKSSLMATVEALSDQEGNAFSNFDGKLTYSAHSHDMKRLLGDLNQITGEPPLTTHCEVLNLLEFQELVLQVWGTIASACNLLVLTFDLKTIEEH